MGRNLTNLPISASFQYLMQVSGSDVNDGLGADIDSLNLDITGTATTASYVAGANVDGTVANATSASFATTASYAENVPVVETGSLMETGSVSDATLTFTKADASTFDLTVNNVANATSASFATSALTASFAEFASGSVDVNAVYTASVSDATLTFEKGDASTFDVTVNNVANATAATTATTANTASYVAGANVDGTVANATSASFATTASFAENAGASTLQEVLDEGNQATGSIVLAENTTTNTPASIEFTSTVGDAKLESGDANTFAGPKLTIGNALLREGNLDLSTSSTIEDSTGGRLNIDTDQTNGISLRTNNLIRMTVNDANITLAQPLTASSALFSGDITGDLIGTASYASNFDVSTLQEVTDAGASTTNAISIDGSSTSQLTILKNGVNNIRFITNDSLNQLTFNTSGSQAAKIDFNDSAGEIEASGDITLDPQSGQVVTTDISASGYVSASSFIGDGSQLTGISSDPFPYTGSAGILGTINIDGSGENIISGSTTFFLSSDSQDVNIKNPDEKLALIVRGGIMAGSDESLSTDNGFNNHLFGERITAQPAGIQTCGALAGREVNFGGNGMEYSAFVATQNSNFDGANKSIIAGGANHDIDTEDSIGQENGIFAGNNARVGGSLKSAVIAGNNNTIIEGQNQVIIGGNDNSLLHDSGVAEYSGSVILGGNNNLSKHNNVVILGGNAITSSAHNTAYANNLTLTGSGATLTFDDGTTMTTAVSDPFPYTGSATISGSLTVDGDATATTFFGDGSNLTGIGSVPFPFTGSAGISGSLDVDGTITGDGSGLTNIAGLVNGSTTDSIISADFLTTNAAVANGTGSIAIGDNAFANGDYNIVIGVDATASLDTAEQGNVVIGWGAEANRYDQVAIGRGAGGTNNSGESVAIGYEANTNSGFAAVAIGREALALNSLGIAIGRQAEQRGTNTIVIGAGATEVNAHEYSVLIGSNAQIDNRYITAVGAYTDATNEYSTALGYGAQATGSIGFNLRFNNAPAMTATTASQAINFAGATSVDPNALSITSNTASLDCTDSNFHTLTLQNGVDTHLEATNITAGQTINLKITNNATAAGTISFGSEFEFEGGTAFTVTASPSAVDVMTFISFDGISLQATGLKNFS